jgi:hypothetical protein
MRSRAVLVPGVIALALAALFVTLRLAVMADGDETKFVVAGDQYVDRARAPEDLFVRTGLGYDGQFYYRFALDPLDFEQTSHGITIDDILRREYRILYPAVVHVLSAGSDDAVPWLMIVVNVLAIGAIGLVGGALARDSGRSPLWGLAFLSFPLWSFSVGRDLTEPLEVALLLAGFYALRRERWGWATAAFAGAALARETAVVVVAVLAVERVYTWIRREDRPGRRDLVWVVPGVAFVAWQAVVQIETDRTGVSQGGDKLTFPFFGLPDFVDRSFDLLDGFHAPGVLQDAQAVVLLLVFALAAFALWRSAAPRREKWAYVALAVVASMLFSRAPWIEESAPRTFADLYAVSLLLLMGTPRRLLVPVAVATPVAVFAMVQQIRFI